MLVACQRVHVPSCNKVSNILIWQHQTISAILQGIEEKQENLLEFEIRNPEEAGKYIPMFKYDYFRNPESLLPHLKIRVYFKAQNIWKHCLFFMRALKVPGIIVKTQW
jgi:hypothetical protein